MISPISRRIKFFTTFEHNYTLIGEAVKTIETEFLKILPQGVFFSKKTQKLLTKFPGLVTSGRHNSAVITDRRKFTINLTSIGCLVSIFTLRINPKSP